MTTTEAKTSERIAGGFLVVVGVLLLISLIVALWLISFRVVPIPVEGAAVVASFFTLILGALMTMVGAFMLGWDG